MTRSYLNDWDREKDRTRPVPRQRVSMNRAAPMPLTGSWQAFPFAAGGSSYDTNSFPEPRYDFTNQLIVTNPAANLGQSYYVSVDFAVSSTQANTGIRFAVRFIVPRPTGAGGPVYFPLPDSLGEMALPDEIQGAGSKGLRFEHMIQANDLVRTYGVGVQLKATAYQLTSSGLLPGLVGALSVVLTGSQRPNLTDAVMNIYGGS